MSRVPLSSLVRLMPLHRLRKLLIWFGAVFAAVILFAFFALPPLARSFLMRTLSEALHREVTIQQISINPFTLSLTVRGVVVKDRETSDTFASFDQLFVNLESLLGFFLSLLCPHLLSRLSSLPIAASPSLPQSFRVL